MKIVVIALLLLMVAKSLHAQPTLGTTGLLNIPTAEMQKDGTFIVGANYLPDPIISNKLFKYDTGNYYFDLTFLPFLEVSYKLTFLKVGQNKFNQDRSVAVRGRLLNERQSIPGIVVGMDDIYSSTENGNHFFKSFYSVATKSFKWNPVNISLTIGQRAESIKSFTHGTMFTGCSLNFVEIKSLKLIAEYDGNVVNAGASLLLFRHLKIQAFANDMKYLTAGIQYYIDLMR